MIALNADRPLSEYDGGWLIRHEFGHTFVLPDYHLESYDEDRQVITGYQIDVTDMMFSRMGKIRRHHFVELEKYSTVRRH